MTKREPSKEDLYSFSWIPNNAQDYSISAIVRDVAGNVRSTAESTISIQDYRGGGVNLEVLGDSNFSIESNGQLLLTAMATSQFGISEVEFSSMINLLVLIREVAEHFFRLSSTSIKPD